MAKKRTRTLPYVRGQSIIWEANRLNWKAVQKAYGHRLSPEARQRIVQATQTYVSLRGRERNSKPVRLSIDYVKRLKKSAEFFLKTLNEGDEDSATHVFACHEIKLQFSDDYLVAPDSVAGLTRVVGSFVSACETVLENHLHYKKQLNVIKAEAIPAVDGTAWRNWIVELTSITAEFGIPSGARTDTDKSDEHSPFVRLVKELQDQLPKELQHQRLSVAALAKAINRARQSRDKSSAKSNANRSRPK